MFFYYPHTIDLTIVSKICQVYSDGGKPNTDYFATIKHTITLLIVEHYIKEFVCIRKCKY